MIYYSKKPKKVLWEATFQKSSGVNYGTYVMIRQNPLIEALTNNLGSVNAMIDLCKYLAEISDQYNEKNFHFSENNVFYSYATTNSKASEEQPNTDDRDLCDTIIQINRFHRDPKTRKIILQTLVQSDSKTSLPAFVIAIFGPKTLKDWFNMWKRYLLNNHNKI